MPMLARKQADLRSEPLATRLLARDRVISLMRIEGLLRATTHARIEAKPFYWGSHLRASVASLLAAPRRGVDGLIFTSETATVPELVELQAGCSAARRALINDLVSMAADCGFQDGMVAFSAACKEDHRHSRFCPGRSVGGSAAGTALCPVCTPLRLNSH